MAAKVVGLAVWLTFTRLSKNYEWGAKKVTATKMRGEH